MLNFDKLKTIFSFSKGERRGIYILLLIILIQILILRLIPYFNESSIIDFSKFEEQINAFYDSKKDIQQNAKISNESIQYFPFNPNTISDNGWQKLGFSDKQIKIINNYKLKGGKFYKKEDLAKIYSIPKQQFEDIKDFIRIENKYKKKQSENSCKSKNKSIIKQKLFNFNPNNVSRYEMQKLGFSEKQIKIITNFRSKGGGFYKKEDLKKIYTISQNQYNRLEPYIVIKAKNNLPKYIKKTVHSVELNSADSVSLVQLPYIGPSYARRILKYRENLGGYTQKEQLFEVYGFTDELFQKINKYINVDIFSVEQININTATFTELIKHPYIDYNLAKAITDVREFNGDFNTIKDLLNYKLVDKPSFLKLQYYLKVK